jgi:hypothetical protein
MITGQKNLKYDTNGQLHMEAIIDLRNITIFEENFFLVVIEKLNHGGSVLHMWRIVISSQPENTGQYSKRKVEAQNSCAVVMSFAP